MEQLKTLIRGEIGRDIIFLGTVDSTNAFAMELAEKGAVHGTVVIAESQTRGRGRMGRRWVSPPGGNIYMSIILIPPLRVKDATLLTIMAGVACCSALRNTTSLSVKIKWPNDLMVSGKKLGGILTEIKSGVEKIIYAVVGIGININIKMEEFPPDVRATATSVREEIPGEQSRAAVTAAILNELDHWHRILLTKGREPLLDEWRKFSSTLGESVKVIAGKEVFTGIADDIDGEGMLILKLPDGRLKRISTGDLTILR